MFGKFRYVLFSSNNPYTIWLEVVCGTSVQNDLENLDMYYLALISHILFGQRWSVAPLHVALHYYNQALVIYYRALTCTLIFRQEI